MGGADRGAGRGSARHPSPAERQVSAGGRDGLLHPLAEGRGHRRLVRAGPGLRHRQAARRGRRPGPVGTGMGQIDGYTVADYLLQHATRQRQDTRVPASTWDALLSHVRDRADAARLAESAEARRLADLLARHGDLDQAVQILRARGDAGDWSAADRLASLLAQQGRQEEADRLRRFGLNPDGSTANG
jgi:hypothetical protein